MKQNYSVCLKICIPQNKDVKTQMAGDTRLPHLWPSSNLSPVLICQVPFWCSLSTTIGMFACQVTKSLRFILWQKIRLIFYSSSRVDDMESFRLFFGHSHQIRATPCSLSKFSRAVVTASAGLVKYQRKTNRWAEFFGWMHALRLGIERFQLAKLFVFLYYPF